VEKKDGFAEYGQWGRDQHNKGRSEKRIEQTREQLGFQLKMVGFHKREALSGLGRKQVQVTQTEKRRGGVVMLGNYTGVRGSFDDPTLGKEI